ncbi:MAG TPA: GSCFA domain-containing protein [Cyclobacteriaceae bacterium]|nr:GSCFA domain-containing protein [Cyclobacteriaceae bacterium]
MKEFRTELNPAVSASPIGLRDSIFAIGSCFADAIGSHLDANKFPVWNNRLGSVYNPISIHRLLIFGLENKSPASESYLQNEGVHLNYHFHSSCSAFSKKELEDKIRTSVGEACGALRNAHRIIITYGTAFVYRQKSSNDVVANCHKVPPSHFAKSLLTETAIVQSFQGFYSTLKRINPGCKIILTLSPVRHVKDTLELNSVSKSILRLSCHSIASRFADVEYFPAYEILLDDLRDYRFYKTDRLHPTDEAIEYIWEKFVTAYFEKSTQQVFQQWEEISKDLEHRPFHPNSENHQKFLEAALAKLEALQPVIDVSVEIRNLKSKITSSHTR